MKKQEAFIYVGLGIAAIWLYSKFKGGLNAVVDTVTQPLANAYVAATSGAAPVPQGSVIFPDGSFIAVASIQPTWYGNALVFTYNAQNWQLQSHDANGNYPAIPFIGG